MIELHQFAYSHFNDKVRWALAWKGLDCRRITYLPGPHIPALRKLFGQPQTPVLVMDDEVIAGSAAIIARLETLRPEPPLYPEDPGHRDAATRWVHRLDADLGPATRATLFAHLLGEPGYLCRIFADGKPLLKRALYRATFPFARPMIARGNGVHQPRLVSEAQAQTRSLLDEIAAAVNATGYLVGDQFSVADLTAAALIAPLCEPDCDDMRRPFPRPAAFSAFIEAWREHPACRWAEQQYREHRPA